MKPFQRIAKVGWVFFAIVALTPVSPGSAVESDSSFCCVVAGDANHDGALNIGDVTHLRDYISNDGAAPVCGTQGL